MSILNARCAVCGARDSKEKHAIKVYGHDVRISATWYLGEVQRAITNIAVREVKSGVVGHTRLVPIAEVKGIRYAIVDQWREGTKPEHSILVAMDKEEKES